jgi:hypothetical protein
MVMLCCPSIGHRVEEHNLDLGEGLMLADRLREGINHQVSNADRDSGMATLNGGGTVI